jgi:hypothetical protein
MDKYDNFYDSCPNCGNTANIWIIECKKCGLLFCAWCNNSGQGDGDDRCPRCMEAYYSTNEIGMIGHR